LNEWSDVVNNEIPTSAPVGSNIGGNFYGGGSTTIINLGEVKQALQLRYVSLVSNGRFSFINRMLRYIFNNDQPWDYAAGNYFYVADNTLVPSTGVAEITQSNYMEYRIGPALSLSDQFLTLLNTPEYGIIPSCAGVKYLVVKES